MTKIEELFCNVWDLVDGGTSWYDAIAIVAIENNLTEDEESDLRDICWWHRVNNQVPTEEDFNAMEAAIDSLAEEFGW